MLQSSCHMVCCVAVFTAREHDYEAGMLRCAVRTGRASTEGPFAGHAARCPTFFPVAHSKVHCFPRNANTIEIHRIILVHTS